MQFVYDPEATTPSLSTVRGNGGSIAIGDINGDGFQDLAHFNLDWPTGDILTNISSWNFDPSSGSFTASNNLRNDAILSFPFSNSIFDDFNADGFDDFFVITNGDESRQGQGGIDYLFLSQPDGSYSNGVVDTLSRYETWGHGTTTGDINDDGMPDVLVSGGFGGADNPVHSFVLYNEGDGVFSQPVSLPGTHATLAEHVSEIWSSEIADLNNDGRSDIIVGHDAGPLNELGSQRVDGITLGTPAHILFRQGDGTYERVDLPNGQLPQLNTDSVDVKAFDADNDGDLDLLISNYIVPGWVVNENGVVVYDSTGADGEEVVPFQFGDVQFLLNDGHGNFSDATEQITAVNQHIMVAGSGASYFQYFNIIDVDADGDLDIYMFSHNPAYASPYNLWMNDGNAHFTPVDNSTAFNFSPTVEPNGGPWTAMPFDYDHDGDWDFMWDEPTDWSVVNNVGSVQIRFTENTLAPDHAFGGSTQRDTLKGTAANETFFLYSGNDVARGEGGNDRFHITFGHDDIYGGSGTDTAVFSTVRNEFSIVRDGIGWTITDVNFSRFGENDLSEIERLQFTDGTLALDLEGNAGQTYRLYKAAFDRAPDETGLAHNVALMDGGRSIFEMASAFIGSAEFQETYGQNVNDTAFLTLLYQNVLDRQPDDAGLAGWLSQIGNGTTREQILFGFSESSENKTTTAPLTNDGIWLG